MIVLNKKIVSFDVDQTLVMWGEKRNEPKEGRILIVDPNDGENMYLTPHTKHIQKLKDYKRSGWFVIVWSASGGDWAHAVCQALDIVDHTSLIIGKPSILFDDLPLNEAFGDRKYMLPKKGWE